jgi:hypothetical protein
MPYIMISRLVLVSDKPVRGSLLAILRFYYYPIRVLAFGTRNNWQQSTN